MIADSVPDLLQSHLKNELLGELCDALTEHVRAHGNTPVWDKILDAVPVFENSTSDFSSDVVTLSTTDQINEQVLRGNLKQLMPWRKGPWQICGINIDSEWRSDQKWRRLNPHITPLHNRRVLDVGCGNGYYLFRMLGDGAKLALGVDPTRLFIYQFQAIKKMAPQNSAFILPLRSEHLPRFNCFDSVFSMGVLYHRRSPIGHLTELRDFLRPGGELILETLVVPGDATTSLMPSDRYAKMINVWFLPSVLALELWLRRTGFINIRTVDICRTTGAEQRKTEWMDFQSLDDFLDPENLELTIEGYPCPTRAILIANKPD